MNFASAFVRDVEKLNKPADRSYIEELSVTPVTVIGHTDGANDIRTARMLTRVKLALYHLRRFASVDVREMRAVATYTIPNIFHINFELFYCLCKNELISIGHQKGHGRLLITYQD